MRSARSTCRRRSMSSTARSSAAASRRSTCRNRWCGCRACSPPIGRTTRRTCRSARAGSARARTFGVRGVRLYQDDIPVTMPDGQGQTGSFSLLSAGRIEVLRGPFSTLYGNASGGVISVYTENGTPEPVLSFTASAGSYDTISLGRQGDRHLRRRRLRRRVQLSRHRRLPRPFGGHPPDRQCQAHVRRRRESTRITVIGSRQYQPHTQDPLGLTYAQWQADPRQADPVTTLFNTNKTISQYQGGLVIDQALTERYERAADRLRRAPDDRTVSGADRGGADLVRRGGRPRPRLRRLRRAAHLERQRRGAAADAQHRGGRGAPEGAPAGLRQQLRRGRRACAATRTIRSPGPTPMPKRSGALLDPLSLTLGVRSSRVHYNSDDHFITRGQSGRQRHAAPTTTRVPIAGRGLACGGQPQPVFQLRAGLRDADLRRARLQPERPGAQLQSRSGDLDRLRAGLEVAAAADASGSISRSSRRRRSRRSW